MLVYIVGRAEIFEEVNDNRSFNSVKEVKLHFALIESLVFGTKF